MSPLYTIGHGTRPIAELINLIKSFGVEYLADVRSRPYSKYNPQYNRESLFTALEKEGIRYVYLGDELGGRPDDPACYDSRGKIDYAFVRRQTFFRKGLERLKVAQSKELKVVLLCSESKPQQCHRSRLIGRALIEEGLTLRHIDEKGIVKDQHELFRTVQDKLFDE